MAAWTWTGSGADGNLANAANYSPGGGPPASGDTVTDADVGTAPSNGTSVAGVTWTISTMAIGGGTFNGPVVLTGFANIVGGVFNNTVTSTATGSATSGGAFRGPAVFPAGKITSGAKFLGDLTVGGVKIQSGQFNAALCP
jgi:hypothetical protein